MSLFSQVVGLFSLGFFATGCASMGRDGSFQTILVQSTPPGASIYVESEKVGETPAFVDVRRSARPKIELETANGLREIEFESSYRWKKSFFRNLIFLNLAPVGWALDLLTGTSWDTIEKPPIPIDVSLVDKARHEAKEKTKGPIGTSVAIAPPRASSQGLSDEGGRALEQAIRDEFQKRARGAGPLRILRYDETLQTFIDNDYEHRSDDVSGQRRLLKALNVDLVYESVIQPAGNIWSLQSKSYESISSRSADGPSLVLDREDSGPRIFGYEMGLTSWWSRILPDTVGFDAVNERLSVELQGVNYDLAPVQGSEWWAEALKSLNGINISSTPDWRRSYGSRWEFSAVPSFRVSRKFVKLANRPQSTSGTVVDREPEFIRWSMTAGYGLEIGYLMGRHYIYFDVIPVFNWSEVTWGESPSSTASATRTTVTGQSELGYTYVFDSSWLVRFFTRSQGENTEIWKDAFMAKYGESYIPTAATAVVTGVTLGYRFDVDRYRATSTRTSKK